jgi:hypothetical protein
VHRNTEDITHIANSTHQTRKASQPKPLPKPCLQCRRYALLARFADGSARNVQFDEMAVGVLREQASQSVSQSAENTPSNDRHSESNLKQMRHRCRALIANLVAVEPQFLELAR